MAARTRIRFVPIIPKIKPAGPILAKHLKPVFEETNKDIERYYRMVSDKFRKNRPEYKSHMSLTRTKPPIGHLTGIWTAVWTENDVMRWLNSGAKRQRRMNYNYQSMTRPGAGLKTFPRKGTPAGWGTSRPIEPREFSRTVALKIHKKFFARSYRAIIAAAIEIFSE